ncbi:MAG TPA: hypothetical protein VF683_11640 [Chthoniobacterales bacterium]|jgi:hypothetical protein
MNPYASPEEKKVGANRPKIQHVAEDETQRRTRRERELEKQGVAAERRAIKKSARRHLKNEMLKALDEPD